MVSITEMYPWIPWERVVHPLGSVQHTVGTGREHQTVSLPNRYSPQCIIRHFKKCKTLK